MTVGSRRESPCGAIYTAISPPGVIGRARGQPSYAAKKLFGSTTVRAVIWSVFDWVTPLLVISLMAVVVPNEVERPIARASITASIFSSIGCQSGA